MHFYEIPSNVTRIGESCFSCCKKLRKVEIPDDSNLEIIREGAFSSTKFEKLKIAIHVQQIHEATFSNCDFFSELQTIEKNAFCSTKIESLTIPSIVSELKRGWCCGTAQLKEIKY